MNAIEIFLKYFRFTSGRNMDVSYFQRSIFDSRSFRNDTVVLCCAILAGIFTFLQYSPVMRPLALLFLGLSIASLLGVWAHTISDHRKVQTWLSTVPRDSVPDDLLKFAAGAANFGSSALYVVALLLILSLGLTAARVGTSQKMRSEGNSQQQPRSDGRVDFQP